MPMGSGKVPVLQCVRDAWGFFARSWQTLLPPAIICAIFAQIGLAAGVLAAPQSAANPSFLTFVPMLLAGVMFTAAIMRKAVRDEYVRPIGLMLGGDEGRLIGVGFSVALLSIPLVFLGSILMVSTVLSRIADSPEAIEALAENPEALMKALEEALGSGGMFVLEIVSIAVMCIIFGLVSFVQATTIGEKRIVLFQALRWLSGNVLRVLAAFVLTVAPTLIFSSVISMGVAPLVTDVPSLLALSIVVGFVGNMLTIPVAGLGAILYKGLRPADFAAK